MRRTIRRIGFDEKKRKMIIESCKKHLSVLLGKINTLDF